MQVEQVFNALLDSVQAEQNQRAKAEKTLLQLENENGFLSSLLRISSSLESKNNKVRSSWDSSSKTPIHHEEKNWVKQNIFNAIAQAPPNQRTILLASINIIISNENYTNSWPELIPNVTSLICSSDSAMVKTGLLVLLEFVKLNQWYQKSKRSLLNSIIESLFPDLCLLANNLRSVADEDAMLMVKTILKIYGCSIRMELSQHQQSTTSLVQWVTLFLDVICQSEPLINLTNDPEELEKHPWWKCKKWAYTSLNGLMGRYARSRKSDKKYIAFSKLFLDQFAVKVLEQYLIQIDRLINGEWVTKRVQQSLITFIEHCLLPKSTWQLVSQHLEPIVLKLIFPLQCFTEDDEKLWEEDPVEYIHKKIDPPIDDFRSPVTASEELLIALATAKFSQVFIPVMKMINNVLSTLDKDQPRLKYGVLNMMCHLSDIVMSDKSPVRNHMEGFMATHVFPELNSPVAYLRAKACDVLTKYSKLNYLEQSNLEIVFHGVLKGLSDSDLPVRVSASLAIGQFLKYPQVIQALKPNIIPVMQGLLNTTNDIDLDTLTNTMELLVFEFAEDLKPFASHLATQLRDTFMRILSDTNFGSDDCEYDEIEEKTIAAMGILKTLSSLILALESSTAIILELEAIILPAIIFVLSHSILDMYEEIFEMVGTILFCAKQVSQNMWKVFPYIFSTFKSDAYDYLGEMLPPLDNFIAYGKEYLLKHKDYQMNILEMISILLTDNNSSESDQIRACQLIESMLLNLRSGIDEHIPVFLELVYNRMNHRKIKTVALRVHCIEAILNSIYYNPILTCTLMDKVSWMAPFCEEWFKNISNFQRVHDKKLSIIAACTILEAPKNNLPVSLIGLRSHFVEFILEIFKTYPEALKARENEAEDSASEDGFDEYGFASGEECINEEVDTLEDLASAAASALPNEADESDDENWAVVEYLQEDICFMTPLDSIDAYFCFANTFNSLINSGDGPELQARLNAEQLELLSFCMGKAQETTQ